MKQMADNDNKQYYNNFQSTVTKSARMNKCGQSGDWDDQQPCVSQIAIGIVINSFRVPFTG